jgi:hypothetical protein
VRCAGIRHPPTAFIAATNIRKQESELSGDESPAWELATAVSILESDVPGDESGVRSSATHVRNLTRFALICLDLG